MRRLRLATALVALLVVVLPMGSPASAVGGGSRGVRSARTFASSGQPFVYGDFNDPSQGLDGDNSSRNIAGDEYLVTAYAESQVSKVLLQVSMYRVLDRNLAFSLVNAASDGNTVQVLLDGSAETLGCHGRQGCVNSTFRMLEQLNTINHETGRSGTWLKTCAGYGPDHPAPLVGAGNGCLGQTLNHNKFMLASQALSPGPQTVVVRDEVLQTSSNDVPAQYDEAFNNALIIANRPGIYHDYQQYFTRLADAYDSTKPTSSQLFTRRTGRSVDDATLSNHDIETLSYPRAANDDPLLTALRSVSTAHRCANRSTSPSSPARTSLYLGMFAISGRSAALHELANLARAGCPVHIVYTVMSRFAYHTLHRPHISLQQLCTTHTNEHQARFFIHSKYLLIAGTTRPLGDDRRIIYTGSENLVTGSLINADNRDIRYVEPATNAPVYGRYLSNFHQMRTRGANSPELGSACMASKTND